MHEFLLFGQIAGDGHPRLLQQLAGVTRMQPVRTVERHLVFRARPPGGLNGIPSGGASQGVLPPDVQRTRQMLNSSLFYHQLVSQLDDGVLASQDVHHAPSPPDTTALGQDTTMSNGDDDDDRLPGRWTSEFRDIPEAGNQPVTIRLMSRTPIEGGDPLRFMDVFGYE